jgi:hypothetical protein
MAGRVHFVLYAQWAAAIQPKVNYKQHFCFLSNELISELNIIFVTDTLSKSRITRFVR